MASTNCIYRSVNLAAGETFVLPPGATLISVSDTNAVTSSCSEALPQSDNKCWRINWVTNVDDEGLKFFIGGFITGNVVIPERNNAWDNEESAFDIVVSNISAGGTIITPAVNCKVDDLTLIENIINNSAISGLMAERKYAITDHVTDNDPGLFPGFEPGLAGGYRVYSFYFKATEEIAKTVYIEFLSGDENIGDIPRYFAREIDCDDYPVTSIVTSC